MQRLISSWNDVVLADIADIGGRGIAARQGVDLFNYYQRLITPAGENALQLNLVIENSITAPEGVSYVMLDAGTGPVPIPQYMYLQTATFATGLGLLSSGEQLNIAGHSLGGQLAMMMGRMFNTSVSNVYTYNAPGFDTNIIGSDETEWFFDAIAEAQIREVGGTTVDLVDFPSAKFNNLAIPNDVISDIGAIPGGQISHYGEATNIASAHFISTATDSLAVYNLLATLDSNTELTLAELTPILQAASITANESLENIVNAMGDLFEAGEEATIGDRDLLYKRINEIQTNSDYSLYENNLSVALVENTTLALAKSDIAYRYAIHNLNPFAITGNDALYDPHAPELELYNEATKTGNLTEDYLEDKVSFINSLINFNRSDDVIGLPQGNTTEYFRDFKTGTVLNDALGNYANGSDRTANRYIFGDARNNLVMGGDGTDKLYGGGGNDILRHTQFADDDGSGDYMEGGAGSDHYYAGGGDRIFDIDGRGHIHYDHGGAPRILSGGKSQTSGGGTYYSPDKSITYQWSGIANSRLTISMQGNAGGITVEDFSNGNLGISLVKPPKPPVPNPFPEAQTTRIQVMYDPLALDLDRDGLETIGVNGANSVLFDLNNDGNKVATGWIAPDDGLLAYDRNNNGTIDDGSELFGDATPINNDTAIAADGFEALADFDSNADGVVDANDAEFANLRVWQDGAIDGVSDGITQTGELKTLDELGIESISTAYENTQFEQNGNVISALGSYTRVDGGLSTVGSASLTGDLNFVVDTYFSEFIDSIPLTAEATVLPLVGGSGRVRNTQEAASLSPEFAAALATYSAATTRDGQLALLDDLLLKWSKSNNMSTILDEGYRLHNFDSCLHYHVQKAA